MASSVPVFPKILVWISVIMVLFNATFPELQRFVVLSSSSPHLPVLKLSFVRVMSLIQAPSFHPCSKKVSPALCKSCSIYTRLSP